MYLVYPILVTLLLPKRPLWLWCTCHPYGPTTVSYTFQAKYTDEPFVFLRDQSDRQYCKTRYSLGCVPMFKQLWSHRLEPNTMWQLAEWCHQKVPLHMHTEWEKFVMKSQNHEELFHYLKGWLLKGITDSQVPSVDNKRWHCIKQHTYWPSCQHCLSFSKKKPTFEWCSICTMLYHSRPYTDLPRDNVHWC